MSAIRRVLAVATKPPFPPVGGGNVALHGLLSALGAHGVEVRVVAVGAAPGERGPYPLRATGAPPRDWARATAAALGGTPLSLTRYRLPLLARLVLEELEAFRPDVVHLEQVHVGWLLPLLAGRAPTVLRQQNVESRLLARVAEVSWPPLRGLLRLEARRMAHAERRACSLAGIVAAISPVDAEGFRMLAPGARVRLLPALWQAEPTTTRERLEGEPPFLCLGSFDWRPNRDGALWLLRDVWPMIRAARPTAVLHLAGPGSATLPEPECGGVLRRGSVARAGSLYDPRGTVLIPLRAGSGVRLRLLEAWANGVPAITTTIGGEGLVAGDGDGAVVAASAPAFADAALRLAGEPARRRELVARGEARLEAHSAERVVDMALAIYQEARGRAA